MIASYLHNFIFIKTKKTAGTTVEMVLAPACGPEDIVTPLAGGRGADRYAEELLRGNGQPLCRNFSADPELEAALRNAIVAADRRAQRQIEQKIGRAPFSNHMTAAAIKRRLPQPFWQAAYKITVERHPYEKAVSQAYYRHGRERSEQPFEEYLDVVVREGEYASYGFYSIDGRVVADEILRQETLQEDLRRVGARLGIAIPEELPRDKGSARTDRRPGREILTPEQKEIVYGFCRNEFELLGYER